MCISEQLIKIANKLEMWQKGYQIILNRILPLYKKLLSIHKITNRVGKDFLQIAELISQEDCSNHILPIALELIHNDVFEQARIEGIIIFKGLISHISREFSENIIANEISSLSDDLSVEVRKQCLKSIVEIGQLISKNGFENNYFHIYLKMANDQDAEIKKLAVELLPQVSELCSSELRTKYLVILFKKFIADQNHDIRFTALLWLGNFFYTLRGLKIDENIMNQVISMAKIKVSSNKDENSTIQYQFAYTLPAIILTVGISGWYNFEETYIKLVQSKNVKIRRTLACSIHEIAIVIGSELTIKVLVPILKDFISDQNHMVRLGAIKGIPKLL